MSNHQDDIIVISLTFILFLMILLLSIYGKKKAILNLVIFGLYNSILYYNYIYSGKYGSGFIWWFYAFLLNSIHLICVLLYLIFRLLKR
jgi:hypothetical protein